MPYRPCMFRSSQLGIFQCEKHFFQHSTQEMYEELHKFCLANVPDRFCSYQDFGFDMSGSQPRLFLNCTHPYQSRPLQKFSQCGEECNFHDKEGMSLH